VETRNQAMDRLVEQARARGANAVLAFRFDVTEAADVGTEVCAYGTAVEPPGHCRRPRGRAQAVCRAVFALMASRMYTARPVRMFS
jgi:hypothetical protein